MTEHDRFEHAGRVAEAEILTSAPVERVWKAWSDPDRLAEWFTDRTKGYAEAGAKVTWYFDRFGISFPYEVIAAEPGSRLLMKGSPQGRPGYFQEILMSPAGEGTRVHVRSSGYQRPGGDDEEEHASVVSGWQMALAIMKFYLERHFGEPKRSFFAMQPAPFEYHRIRTFFTDEWHLSRWLTSSGAPGEVGQAYRMELRGGDTMCGEVLAVTGHELALSWDEINGVLEMKAFRLGPRQRAVCLRGCAWDMLEEARLEVESTLSSAIDRLVAALKEPSTPRSGNGHGAVH